MAIKTHLYSGLSEYTGGISETAVNGKTIGECLRDLTGHFPGLREVLFDKAGALHGHVFVSLNMQSLSPEQVTSPVNETDELHIALIIAGG